MRQILSGLFAVLGLLWLTGCGSSSYEDGAAAFERGDREEAFQIWEGLAEGGDVESQFALGNLNDSKGVSDFYGVPSNDALAVKWYEMAADQGHAGAQYFLAHMYEDGRGVSEDYVAAYKWYIVLAAAGDEGGDYGRDHLAEKMSADQIAKAQRLAGKWNDAR